MSREEMAKLLDDVLIVLHSHEQNGGVGVDRITIHPDEGLTIHLK